MNDEIYLNNAIEIKNWIDNSENKLPPSKKSKDEIEKRYAKDLKEIRKKIVKPYQKLKKEKAIIEFEEKHPHVHEIIKIVQKIDESEITESVDTEEKELIVQDDEINSELENTPQVFPEFDYDSNDDKQINLVNLITKDLSLKNKIEEANKLKKKYEES